MQNYLELLDCVWKHCRIHCIWRNLVVLVLFVETPLYSKIDWRISPWIFSLLFLEIILSTELLCLSGWLDVCWKHVDSTICSPYWRDANTASILTQCCIFGSQTLVELHASRTNEDVRMYTCRIYSSRDLDTLLHKLKRYWTVLYTELNWMSIGRMLVYIHSQQRNEKCENCS